MNVAPKLQGQYSRPTVPILITPNTNTVLLSDSVATAIAYKLPQIVTTPIAHVLDDTGCSNSSIAIGYGSKVWTSSGASSGSDSGGGISIGSGSCSWSGAINIGNNYLIGDALDTSNTYGAKGTGAIAIGRNSKASGNAIALGISSQAVSTGAICIGATSANYLSAIAIGTGASAQANYSIALGYGSAMSCTSSYASSIAIGSAAQTDFIGEMTYSMGAFSLSGDAKISWSVMNTTTTTATPVELGLGNSSGATVPTNRIILTNDSSYIIEVDVVARDTLTDSQSAAWKLQCLMVRGAAAANTALIGTVTKTIIAKSTNANNNNWDVNITADTTNGRPNISVTGEAGSTIRWVANLKLTKVTG